MRVSGPALALARAHTGPQLKGADQDSSQARWPELWVAVIRGTPLSSSAVPRHCHSLPARSRRHWH